jgi:hypothetical protein
MCPEIRPKHHRRSSRCRRTEKDEVEDENNKKENSEKKRGGGEAVGREEVIHRFNMSLSAALDQSFIAYDASVCLH